MRVFHVAIFVCVLLALTAEAKKKKKADQDNRRPSTVEPLLYCNACQAIVREVLKKIKDSKREYDVTDAISDMCQYKYFSVYEYPPPDMKKGCEAFMAAWNDELETALIKRANNSEIEDQVCREITHACEGVEKGARKANDDYVTINGKKVKMGDDGKVDINMAGDQPPDDDL